MRRANMTLISAAVLLTVLSGCGTVAAAGAEVAPLQEPELSSLFHANSITGTTLTGETLSLGYWLYEPENPTGDMPLIVYLHGASGRGDDLETVLEPEDLPKYLNEGALGEVASYVLIPQLPSDMRSWNLVFGILYNLIQRTISDYSIDASNISLAGFSMGGAATWEFSARHPELFARVAPLSGSAERVLGNAAAFEGTPVRAFVGSADSVVSPETSEQMVGELKEAGVDATLTVFDGAEHTEVPFHVYHDEGINLVLWLIGVFE